MFGLALKTEPHQPLRVLCIGAHSDDIEIGCGGTLLKLIEEQPRLSVHWVVFGANQPARAAEAVGSAQVLLQSIQTKTIVVKQFRDSFFPYIGTAIKEEFEQLKDVAPDIIFTHYRNDLHQDHRLLAELTWNTFRDHFILEYEIPKYDGDIGAPNLFVPLSENQCQRKVDHILQHFATQGERHWFTPDLFYAFLRLRGMESRSPSKYAEAFYCRKITVS